jgi:glutathione S-transferase
MPQITLTYFDAPGRAEPVRLALRLGGVPFTDTRVDFPTFAKLKAEGALPLGFVPVLEVDGLKLSQTAAMLRYAARLGDASLYPAEPLAAFIVDSVIDAFNDTLANALTPSFREPDMGKKLAMRAEFAAGPMVRVFDYVDGLLARSGGPFLLGEALTIADLVIGCQLAAFASGRLDGLTTEHLAPWPRLVALGEAFARHPRLARA